MLIISLRPEITNAIFADSNEWLPGVGQSLRRGSLIDNLGSDAAGSWTVCLSESQSIRCFLSLPILTLTLTLTLTQTTILGSTTCSSHVPIATARQFHA